MKIFKNFKTKKQLREENERLKATLSVPLQIHTVERNVQKVKSSFVVPYDQRDIPEDIIKKNIAMNMVEFLQPLIEYDFSDDKHGGKIDVLPTELATEVRNNLITLPDINRRYLLT